VSQVHAEPENFDEVFAASREFILGGQRFHWVQMQWREWGEFLDKHQEETERKEKEREDKLEKLRKEASARGEDPSLVILEDRSTVIENYEMVVERIIQYIEPSEHVGFKAILEDRTKRISIEQLQLLLNWLQEVQTPERPTTTPEPSEGGPGETEAISQVA
jgi:hypothetical protein